MLVLEEAKASAAAAAGKPSVTEGKNNIDPFSAESAAARLTHQGLGHGAGVDRGAGRGQAAAVGEQGRRRQGVAGEEVEKEKFFSDERRG